MPRNLPTGTATSESQRITSIDALRGFVMFMMIFVNDLAGAGKTVPDWMVHFSERHRGGSGMTFVDLVFPAFLFIVGMSIPVSLGRRIAKGEPLWRTFGHVSIRTLSLLLIGILMVHETPDSTELGWSGHWWTVLMYLSAMAAFCSISPSAPTTGSKSKAWRNIIFCIRLAGLATLVWLAFAFRGPNGQTIITLAPLRLDTEWYGILGLIAWAYLVASLVFLIFGKNRTAILGCMTLLMCLFAADKAGMFQNLRLNQIVGVGETLGSQGALTVGGLLLGAMLCGTDKTGFTARTRFLFLFASACAAAALLLNPLYGISKNNATPSWCLWACAITALLWYLFYLVSEVRPVKFIWQPLAVAGQNVLLAYLISEMLPGLFDALRLGGAYAHLAANLPSAIARSAICGILILLASASLNRLGFRLKL